MEKQNNNTVQDLTYIEEENDLLLEIWTYCKKRFSHILWNAVISLTALLLVFLIICCWMPRTKTYMLNHKITLKEEGNALHYPNGRIFQPEDLLSPIVLSEVYEKLNVKKYISYSKFCAMLSVEDDIHRKTMLSAQYAAKFNLKFLRLNEINQLEQEYSAAVKAKKTNRDLRLRLNTKNKWIPEKKASRILYAISNTWFEKYSKLEANPYLQIESAERIKQAKTEVSKNNYLIPLEQARTFSNNMLAICNSLEGILNGKKLNLPSGEYISDLKKEIHILQQYQINVYLSYIALHPQYLCSFDKVFLLGALERVEKDCLNANAISESIVTSLDTIYASSNVRPVSSGHTSKQSVITLQLDSSFFNSISKLIRSDINAGLREKYSIMMMNNKETAANFEAEKRYYQNLLGYINNLEKNKIISYGEISEKQLQSIIYGMFDEVILLNNKVTRFRDLVLTNYISNDLFYTVDSTAFIQKDFIVPIKIVIAILLVLWFLGNGAFAAVDFISIKNQNEKSAEDKE